MNPMFHRARQINVVERLTGKSALELANDEIAMLRAKLAAKEAEEGTDDQNEGSDVDKHTPPKKGKTKKKPTADGEPDEDKPEGDDEDGSEERELPAPPAENDDREEKDASAYRAQVAAGIQTIVRADATRRGVSAPKPAQTASEQRAEELNDMLLVAELRAGYHGNAEHTAAQICAADRVRRGVSAPPPMPLMRAQPGFFGQERNDAAYWRAVNASIAMVIAADKRRRGEESS